MARDYKNSGRASVKRKSDKKSGGLPGPLWLLLGMVIGVTVGLLLGLGVFTVRVVKELQNEVRAVMARHPNLDADRLRKAIAQVEAESKAADARSDNRPRFEFYKILPQMEVVVPEPEQPARTPAKPSTPVASRTEQRAPAQNESRTAATAARQERYLLQVGAYGKHEDADRIKAQLALLGVQANIQTVEIKPGSVVHRVRVGPFHSEDDVAATRQRLRANGIDSVLMKVSG